MKSYVLDSFAMIALFRREPGEIMVRQILHEIIDGEAEAWMSSINVGELYYMLRRKNNSAFAKDAVEAILKLPISIHEPNLNFTLWAAQIKSGSKISFADAHASALALEKKATLVTGDHEFVALKKLSGFKVKFI
jgi:predicted nucleic acid-binding protein